MYTPNACLQPRPRMYCYFLAGFGGCIRKELCACLEHSPILHKLGTTVWHANCKTCRKYCSCSGNWCDLIQLYAFQHLIYADASTDYTKNKVQVHKVFACTTSLWVGLTSQTSFGITTESDIKSENFTNTYSGSYLTVVQTVVMASCSASRE